MKKIVVIIRPWLLIFYFLMSFSWYIIVLITVKEPNLESKSKTLKLITDNGINHQTIYVVVFPLMTFLFFLAPIIVFTEYYLFLNKVSYENNKNRRVVIKEMGKIDKSIMKKVPALLIFYVGISIAIAFVVQNVYIFLDYLNTNIILFINIWVLISTFFILKNWYNSIFLMAIDINQKHFLKNQISMIRLNWKIDLIFATLIGLLIVIANVLTHSFSFYLDFVFLLIIPIILPCLILFFITYLNKFEWVQFLDNINSEFVSQGYN